MTSCVFQDKEKEQARLEEEQEHEQKEASKSEEKQPGFDGTWYTDINEEQVAIVVAISL